MYTIYLAFDSVKKTKALMDDLRSADKQQSIVQLEYGIDLVMQTIVSTFSWGRPQQADITYKIAIFPFASDTDCIGWYSRPSHEKFANQLGALITSNNSLTLAYSHYDKYLNHPPIKTPGRLWKGSKPNLAQVLWLGETRGVDTVVMYWRATSTGGVYCTDRMPPFPIDIYVIDVQQQKTYKLNGREENISALAEQALSRFLAGRQ